MVSYCCKVVGLNPCKDEKRKEVEQLIEQHLPNIEDLGSNPAIKNYKELLNTVEKRR